MPFLPPERLHDLFKVGNTLALRATISCIRISYRHRCWKPIQKGKNVFSLTVGSTFIDTIYSIVCINNDHVMHSSPGCFLHVKLWYQPNGWVCRIHVGFCIYTSHAPSDKHLHKPKRLPHSQSGLIYSLPWVEYSYTFNHSLCLNKILKHHFDFKTLKWRSGKVWVMCPQIFQAENVITSIGSPPRASPESGVWDDSFSQRVSRGGVADPPSPWLPRRFCHSWKKQRWTFMETSLMCYFKI